jgi:hypothetical protein
LTAPAATRFKRGDANTDGRINVADGVHVLSYLFGTREHLGCHDAADSNDDGRLDIADGIAVFRYLFIENRLLLPPIRFCGYDPTPDGLDCDRFDPCR